MKIYSNIVPADKVREVQGETLQIISDALSNSFGPNGSTTAFVKNIDPKGVNIAMEYTKDGHTIVKNIQFTNPIERSVQDLLTEMTRYIVKEVGDGTTSAIMLCNDVFHYLMESEAAKKETPAVLINKIHTLITKVKQNILDQKRECTLDDIKDIALISTNNNEEVASTLQQVYKKFGLDVYIDVGVSTEYDTIIKEYDGMTLETGFTDECFINSPDGESSIIRNPFIYCFNDPIDTPEMLALVAKIIESNIINPCTRPQETPIPTVIFCAGRISPDTSSYFENVVMFMKKYPNVPLLIVSDIHQDYLFNDIAKMCGAPLIKKYLDPDMQTRDIEEGLAPNLDSVVNFYGKAEMIQADHFKTKIIRPQKMYNDDGTESDDYKALLGAVEAMITKAKNEDAGIEAIARAKKRYHSLKGNMVDYLVGGMTNSDRNNLKAAVEDAVLNCRSAVVDGVGYGANFMAFSEFRKLNTMRKNDPKLFVDDYADSEIIDVFDKAYTKLMGELYGKSYPADAVEDIIEKCAKFGHPLNIATDRFDHKVLSSIKSDVAILETIDKILTLMFTCNQYLVQTPMHNLYAQDK